MVSDQEPRYRLVDANGNIVGSLYGKADGSIAIQETASGSDREVALAPDGTFSAPSGDFDSVSTESLATNIEDGTDMSDSRSFGSTYQNNNDYDIIVLAYTEPLESGETARLLAYIQESSSNVTSVANVTDQAFADGDTAIERATVQFRVPAGHHYQLNLGSGSASVGPDIWNERGVTSN